jgi:DNA repair protein RecN (Recombination protein N)
MLVELSIRNLALFEQAEFCFQGGLNVITGETGAGKSLSLGALELLLGQRPRTKMVRTGAAQARVDGRFVFAPGAAPGTREASSSWSSRARSARMARPALT